MSAYSDGLVIRTLETPGLGDRSYIALHDGWAVAVDVQRDLDRVEDILRAEKATLGAVVETHIHNDYLTGGLVLARRHGAEYVVPAGPRLGYSATRATDGTTVRAGAMSLRSIDSPGHTDAHAAYSVHVEDQGAQAAFTGGSLLLGATGRSDLLGMDKAESLARQQYWSVRRMARILGGDTRILPTHGFGSFCVAGSTVASGDTVAEQLDANPAYLLTEDDFVADLLSKLGDYPRYYAFMGPRNAGGVVTADLPAVPEIDLAAVRARLDAGSLVVDIREREAWAAAHLAGSLSIDARGPLATWLGWIAPIDADVTLISPNRDESERAVRELHRIGFDSITGVHVAGRLDEDADVVGTPRVTFANLAAEYAAGGDPLVIDTREAAEWRGGHLQGAIHVSAHDITDVFAGALPLDVAWLYCGAGLRAAIAASQLEHLGGRVMLIDDQVAGAADAGVPWCDGSTCTDHLCTSSLVPAVAVLSS